MKYLTKYFKGKEATTMGLAGVGDLYVSAAGGRNSKMGSYLGKGFTFKKVHIVIVSKILKINIQVPSVLDIQSTAAVRTIAGRTKRTAFCWLRRQCPEAPLLATE